MHVLEPEELTECPDHDEELSRDSYLSPPFPSHKGYSNWARIAWRQIATARTVMTEVMFYIVWQTSSGFPNRRLAEQ
jgi:hypothetical protein